MHETEEFIEGIYDDEASEQAEDISSILRRSKVSHEGNDAWYYVCLAVENSTQLDEESAKRVQGAIQKYHVIRGDYNLNIMELDPFYYDHERDDSLSDSELVSISNTVDRCHSGIEEIGLKIPASEAEPAVITENGSTRWNPTREREYRERLEERGINPDCPTIITSRIGFERPIKEGYMKSLGPCEWSDGAVILDFETPLIDAILNLRYTRNKIAGHASLKDRRLLFRGDAIDAFSILRVVLLSYLGLYSDLTEDIKRSIRNQC